MSSAFKHGNLYRRLIGFFHVISLKTGIHHNIELKHFILQNINTQKKLIQIKNTSKNLKILFAFFLNSCQPRELDFVKPFFTVTKNQNSHHKSFVHYPSANILNTASNFFLCMKKNSHAVS